MSKKVTLILLSAIGGALPAQVIEGESSTFRSREEMIEEKSMEYRGMGNQWRELTPVLKRSYEKVAYVDEQQLYRRQLASLETGEVFHEPLRIVRHEGARKVTKAGGDPIAPPIKMEPENTSARKWTIGVILSMLVLMGIMVRHARKP